MRELMAHSVEVWESDPEDFPLSSSWLYANKSKSDGGRCRLYL